MPKRETIKFTHMGTYGEADLVDGVPVCVSWRTCTADWGQCGPELRHSVEQAIQARQPLETPFTRLARLEGEVREMRCQLTELAALVAARQLGYKP